MAAPGPDPPRIPSDWHRQTRRTVGGQYALAAGGHEDGPIVTTERERVPCTVRRESAAERLGVGCSLCRSRTWPGVEHALLVSFAWYAAQSYAGTSARPPALPWTPGW